MTAWLAEHGLEYAPATVERISRWAVGRDNGHEFIVSKDDGHVRIKPYSEWGPQIWHPLDNMADAWLLVEVMVEGGSSPNLVFDDNLVEDAGAWCCTCDGANEVPDPDAEDVPDMYFSALCRYWYATPELAICACAALYHGKVLVQEKENRFELYDEPEEPQSEWVKNFIKKLEGETDDSTAEEGTPGTDG